MQIFRHNIKKISKFVYVPFFSEGGNHLNPLSVSGNSPSTPRIGTPKKNSTAEVNKDE